MVLRHLARPLARFIHTQAYKDLKTDPHVVEQYFRISPTFDRLNKATSTQHSAIAPGSFSLDDFILFPNFLSSEEHDRIVDICNRKLKRVLGRNAPYVQGHFDKVITGYKECRASHWGFREDDEREIYMNRLVKERIYSLFPDNYRWLDPHILDLSPDGEIRGHVDNIEASGSVVAGLCLLSPAKMTLQHEKDPECRVDVLLEPGCFYIQRDTIRYNFTHAIAGATESIWNGKPIQKDRRISLLFRNEKDDVKGQ
ncbi:uncharacterized protein BYT42DRAFT_198949 [Radiomyces spectabilis]|uniref:uncharacterized protein n=1 Tax=Radiomyces spectabilis TaxID=64574 RepID=UPI00222037C8|nr:uncharacterized protein BYT42DRAFT_198949 [Radiomyces spectabilis]KAI8391538.1 hypothetical protein BYT42DRAFT_198949 [Radiomyces spectabilis]